MFMLFVSYGCAPSSSYVGYSLANARGEVKTTPLILLLLLSIALLFIVDKAAVNDDLVVGVTLPRSSSFPGNLVSSLSDVVLVVDIIIIIAFLFYFTQKKSNSNSEKLSERGRVQMCVRVCLSLSLSLCARFVAFFFPCVLCFPLFRFFFFFGLFGDFFSTETLNRFLLHKPQSNFFPSSWHT